MNDEELGQSVVYAERPPHELTDVDFHTVRSKASILHILIH